MKKKTKKCEVGSFIKLFWKEIIFVFVIAFALVFYATSFRPQVESDLLSPLIHTMSLMAIIFPIIPAIIGGFLVGNKSKELIHFLMVPTMGLILLGLLTIVVIDEDVSMLNFFSASEEEWNVQTSYVNEIAPIEISVAQYKFISTMQIIPYWIQILLNSVALGMLGGLIGKKIYFMMR